MKKRILISVVLILVVALTVLIFNRYKTKRIEHLIGADQASIEKLIYYPNDRSTLEQVAWDDVEEGVKEIMESNSISTDRPILKYTSTGSIRKFVCWLVDQGDGYYVVEALETNK